MYVSGPLRLASELGALTIPAGIECQANQGAESEGCTVAWGICNVRLCEEIKGSVSSYCSMRSTSTAFRVGSRLARVCTTDMAPLLCDVLTLAVCPLDKCVSIWFRCTNPLAVNGSFTVTAVRRPDRSHHLLQCVHPTPHQASPLRPPSTMSTFSLSSCVRRSRCICNFTSSSMIPKCYADDSNTPVL